MFSIAAMLKLEEENLARVRRRFKDPSESERCKMQVFIYRRVLGSIGSPDAGQMLRNAQQFCASFSSLARVY